MIIYGDPLGTNMDFEQYTGTQDDGVTDAFTGWTVEPYDVGSYIDATATTHSGSNAVKLFRITGAIGSPSILQDILPFLTVGEYYKFSIWSRSAIGASALAFGITGDINSNIVPLTLGAFSTSYVETIVYFTVPSGDSSINFYALNIFFDATGAVYLDSIELREGVEVDLNVPLRVKPASSYKVNNKSDVLIIKKQETLIS